MKKNYAIELLNKELARLLDARDVLNSYNENPEMVNIKIKNIENSIKTLETNRGLVVTDSEGGKMVINENGVTFSGNFTVTPATVTVKVDTDKYKWDKTDVDNVSEVLNKMWRNFKNENFSGKPRNKEEALKYLKNYNEEVRPELKVTRLRYNDGKDYVQDLSFYANTDYMSYELLEALMQGQTLTDSLEKELNQFIIEKTI